MDITALAGRVDIGLRKRPKADVIAFGKLMAALAMMKARDNLVGFQIEVYEDATVDVPLPVLAEAVSRLMKTPDTWRPDPGTLLASCEKVRLEKREALKFEPCGDCSKDGWTSALIGGVSRMTRCPCWHAHQARVQQIAGGPQPLALPPARDSDWTQAGDVA